MSAGAFIATKAGILPQDLKRHPKKRRRLGGRDSQDRDSSTAPILAVRSRSSIHVFGKARADQLKLENERSHDAMRRWPGKSLRIEEAISLIDRLNGIGATCLLLGGRDDAACLDAIAPGLVFFPALYLPWWI